MLMILLPTETESDVDILMECLKCQRKDFPGMKRSLLALASVFNSSGEKLVCVSVQCVYLCVSICVCMCVCMYVCTCTRMYMYASVSPFSLLLFLGCCFVVVVFLFVFFFGGVNKLAWLTRLVRSF